jgi:hypothetical protein
VALVRTDVTEELIASIVKVERISELVTRRHILEDGVLGRVRFDVFTAITMKTAVFWDATPTFRRNILPPSSE